MFGVSADSVFVQPTPASWMFLLHNRCVQGSILQWTVQNSPLPDKRVTDYSFGESTAQGMPVENFGMKPKYSFSIDEASPELVYGEQGIANEVTLIVCAGIKGDSGDFKPRLIRAGDKARL